MYSLLTQADHTDGSAARRLADAIRRGEPVEDGHLFNVFGGPAFRTFPELERLRAALLEAGARSVHLAGSGPAVFALIDDPAEREHLASAATEAGARAFAATSVPAAETLTMEVATG
jgi:4-diphosphocytidyl-2C-methyl-D-erythritol kinase